MFRLILAQKKNVLALGVKRNIAAAIMNASKGLFLQFSRNANDCFQKKSLSSTCNFFRNSSKPNQRKECGGEEIMGGNTGMPRISMVVKTLMARPCTQVAQE